jgi:pimeloyl-ACP methyl ester carboxylesterase
MLPRLLTDAASDALRAEVRAMMLAAPVAGIVGALVAMRDRPDSTDLLPTLASLPTLVVVGEEDALTPPSDAESIAAGVPGARLAVIPMAGHLSPLEQPQAFNRHLGMFLEGLPGPIRAG